MLLNSIVVTIVIYINTHIIEFSITKLVQRRHLYTNWTKLNMSFSDFAILNKEGIHIRLLALYGKVFLLPKPHNEIIFVNFKQRQTLLSTCKNFKYICQSTQWNHPAFQNSSTKHTYTSSICPNIILSYSYYKSFNWLSPNTMKLN